MSGPDAYPEPPMPGPDPRTEGAVRIPDFCDRDGGTLRCRECANEWELEVEWLDARIRDTIGCPACGIFCRIPSDDG